VLGRLPASLGDLPRHARIVSYWAGDLINEADCAAESLVFPVSVIASVLLEMADGLSSELTSVGREGVLGLPNLTGASLTGGRTIAAVPGDALVVPTAVVKTWLRQYSDFRAAVNQAGYLQVA
jgi:hypothetical protein